MNNKVILLILLASVVIQLVMLATQKFTTALIISGGTLAVIALFKMYNTFSRKRIKARTTDEDEVFETPPESLQSSQRSSFHSADDLFTYG